MSRQGRTHGVALGEDALRLRAQTVAIGVAVTYGAVAALAVWVAATWRAPHRGLLCCLLAAAALTATTVAVLPHERILRSRWREAFFLTWSMSYVVVIGLMAAADGGARSPATSLYFLTLVFAALSYPVRIVAVVSAATLVSYVGLALVQPIGEGPVTISPASVWVFAACLGLVAVMCIWQARINARNLSRLGRLSRTDPLTRVLNRFGFEERAQELLRDAAATGAPAGIVLLDLVGFKAVNDTLGHPAGDALLQWVAHALKA